MKYKEILENGFRLKEKRDVIAEYNIRFGIFFGYEGYVEISGEIWIRLVD